MSETLASRALNTLHEWVQSESLRKHCYAVADSMKHFAKLRGGDVDLWEAVGLLHDMDYERHPNHEQNPTDGHPSVGVAWLRDHGWSEEVCHAILSHANYTNVARETPLVQECCPSEAAKLVGRVRARDDRHRMAGSRASHTG